MKIRTLATLLMLAGLICAAMSAYAQNLETVVLRAQVPFEFVVGGVQLPAGEYNFKQLTQHIILIQSPDRVVTMTRISRAVESVTAKPSGRVVFNRYGQRYFLAQIWPGDHTRGHELLKSADELEYAKNMSKQVVTIAARR